MDSLGTDFDTLLTRGAVYALLGAAVWAVLVVAAVAVEARSRGRIRLAERTGCPPAVRLWLLGLFVALFTTVAPANASDSGAGPAIGTAVDGLPLPDRAVDRPAAPRPSTATVVVRAGDSLWQIARNALARDADDADVATTVRALYTRNRDVIGPDPDLLRPGQRLDFPDPTTLPEEP